VPFIALDWAMGESCCSLFSSVNHPGRRRGGRSHGDEKGQKVRSKQRSNFLGGEGARGEAWACV
jgi:hypothetical protein